MNSAATDRARNCEASVALETLAFAAVESRMDSQLARQELETIKDESSLVSRDARSMLGFAEPDARKWAAAVMRRSRNRAAEHDQVARRMATAVHDELRPLAPQAKARWGDERQALEPDAKPREFREREDGVSRAVRAAGGLAGLPSRDSAALENYALLMRHWQAAALASIDKRDLGLCLGAALCLGVAAGLIVSTMENASFEPYFVGLFVAIAVCSRVFLKETEGTERKEAYPDPRQTPPARRTNGMYQPGESGNPHDRPISAPGPFSQPFISDLAAVWELHGETALARTAVEYPDRFVVICSHLLPRDVMLAIEHRVPGGLDPADFAILKAIKAAIPDANSRAPADVLNYVCEAIQRMARS